MTNGGGPGHGGKPKRKLHTRQSKAKSTTTQQRRRAWLSDVVVKSKSQ